MDVWGDGEDVFDLVLGVDCDPSSDAGISRDGGNEKTLLHATSGLKSKGEGEEIKGKTSKNKMKNIRFGGPDKEKDDDGDSDDEEDDHADNEISSPLRTRGE